MEFIIKLFLYGVFYPKIAKIVIAISSKSNIVSIKINNVNCINSLSYYTFF